MSKVEAVREMLCKFGYAIAHGDNPSAGELARCIDALYREGCECRHHIANVYVSDCPMLADPNKYGQMCPEKPCVITEQDSETTPERSETLENTD